MAFPSVLFFVLSLFIPNSPYWLVQVDREDEARTALQWLRGGGYEVGPELDEIVEKKRQNDATKKEDDKKGVAEAGRRLLDVIKSAAFLRISVLMSLSEWSGVNVLGQYMVIIFEASGTTILEPTSAPILVASVRVALAVTSTFVLRYSPRKPLLIGSAMVICASHCAMAAFLSAKAGHEAGQSLDAYLATFGCVPLAALTLIQAAQTIGFLAVLHFNLQAESFPTEVRSVACGLVGVVTSLSRFATTKLFPQLVGILNMDGVFMFYAAVTGVFVVYAYLVVPENQGQSLVKTEDKFRSKAKNGDAT
jgi:hypothetical protein